MNTSVKNVIAKKFQVSPGSLFFQPVSGGSINQTGKLTIANTNFFCKINIASKFPHLFEKEEKALRFLLQQKIFKIPTVYDCIETGPEQVLILEWINSGAKTHQFWKSFGEQLAGLHYVSNQSFGWHEDNYMGSVVQPNQWTPQWISFFTSQRLMPLAHKCMHQNLLTSKHLNKLEKVSERLGDIFEPEPPALLHGDLWSGNFMCSEKGEPILIDPAIYFGHRSMDLAMSTLFGGFDKSFYEAYHYSFPLPANYQQQWEVCNLYPLLIHLLLFGSSYRSQIESTIDQFGT